jgi:hypothetical protein
MLLKNSAAPAKNLFASRGYGYYALHKLQEAKIFLKIFKKFESPLPEFVFYFFYKNWTGVKTGHRTHKLYNNNTFLFKNMYMFITRFSARAGTDYYAASQHWFKLCKTNWTNIVILQNAIFVILNNSTIQRKNLRLSWRSNW